MSSNESRGKDLAHTFRKRHSLGNRPLGDLFELVFKTMGIDVMSLEADQAEHGLLMQHPRTEQSVIAVATSPHPMRQRSSIAHELGHYLAGDLDNAADPAPGRRTNREITADAFARHLLLPLAALNPVPLGGSDAADLQNLSDVVRDYGVSPKLASIQMRDAGVISLGRQREWALYSSRRLATDFGWLGLYDAQAAAAREPRPPQALMRRSVLAYKRGLLGISELAAWYGSPAEQLIADLGQPGIWQTPRDDWDSGAPLFPDGIGS